MESFNHCVVYKMSYFFCAAKPIEQLILRNCSILNSDWSEIIDYFAILTSLTLLPAGKQITIFY